MGSGVSRTRSTTCVIRHFFPSLKLFGFATLRSEQFVDEGQAVAQADFEDRRHLVRFEMAYTFIFIISKSISYTMGTSTLSFM
jgi:hypothetical protein